ncbi:MAG: hypothetical protein HY716_02350 [Planctomycetes bacterium]|nr:hypothetical protein [Planctomycetota bacterium]
MDPPRKVHVVRRKDSDNRILDCAVDVKADVLITGDRQDLLPLVRFEGIDILTPRDFLRKHVPKE